MVLLDTELLWTEKKYSFYYIEDTNFLINIKWSKNHEKDYSELADAYFNCAYEICIEVVTKDITMLNLICGFYQVYICLDIVWS